MTRPLSPGDRVLVLASRLDLPPAEAAELSVLVAAGPDWETLLEDARTFGLLPLLHRHLADLGPAVPESVRKRLATAYHLQSMKSLQMFGALGRLQAALDEAGLPAIVLKGAFLGPWLYRDIGLRPMADLDLLIHPGDRAAVTVVAEGLGFHSRAEDQETYNNPVDAELLQRVGHPPPLYLDRVCRLELHLNILLEDCAGPTPVMAEIWAAPMRRDGALGLPLEPLLLFLASHLDRHVQSDGYGQLYWFCDLHELVRQAGPELDWVRLAALAETLGKAPALARALGWIREGWNTPLPPGVDAGGGPPLAQILDNGRSRRRDPLWQAAPVQVWRRLAMVRHARGWRAKTSYLAGLALPTRAKLKAVHDPRTPLAWAFCTSPIHSGNAFAS